jgi:hypothetical protein
VLTKAETKKKQKDEEKEQAKIQAEAKAAVQAKAKQDRAQATQAGKVVTLCADVEDLKASRVHLLEQEHHARCTFTDHVTEQLENYDNKFEALEALHTKLQGEVRYLAERVDTSEALTIQGTEQTKVHESMMDEMKGLRTEIRSLKTVLDAAEVETQEDASRDGAAKAKVIMDEAIAKQAASHQASTEALENRHREEISGLDIELDSWREWYGEAKNFFQYEVNKLQRCINDGDEHVRELQKRVDDGEVNVRELQRKHVLQLEEVNQAAEEKYRKLMEDELSKQRMERLERDNKELREMHHKADNRRPRHYTTPEPRRPRAMSPCDDAEPKRSRSRSNPRTQRPDESNRGRSYHS